MRTHAECNFDTGHVFFFQLELGASIASHLTNIRELCEKGQYAFRSKREPLRTEALSVESFIVVDAPARLEFWGDRIVDSTIQVASSRYWDPENPAFGGSGSGPRYLSIRRICHSIWRPTEILSTFDVRPIRGSFRFTSMDGEVPYVFRREPNTFSGDSGFLLSSNEIFGALELDDISLEKCGIEIFSSVCSRLGLTKDEACDAWEFEKGEMVH